MQKSEIKIGQNYALREQLKPDTPFQRIKILEHARGSKWKAEWIDPNPGLVDFVESKYLVVRWKDHRAFLRDEESNRMLQDENKRQQYCIGSPLDDVLHSVFEATGEKQDLRYYKGDLSGKKDALERVMARSKIDSNQYMPYSYTDRHGTVHIPYAEALKIAKAFCMTEPNAALVGIEATEREWEQDATRPGKEYMVELLNRYRASWAIIKQWAGLDAAVAQREKYTQQLERLVWDAIYALQKAGADDEAKRLRRAVERNL